LGYASDGARNLWNNVRPIKTPADMNGMKFGIQSSKIQRDTILLHLLADIGNKTKHLRIREEFEAIEDVKVRIRLPEGRRVKEVSQLRSSLPFFNIAPRDGWIDITVPRIFIHEVIRVDLA